MTDNCSGFSDLLANLIEKYAAVLNIDNLPEPPEYIAGKFNSEDSAGTIVKTENDGYNNRVNSVQTLC